MAKTHDWEAIEAEYKAGLASVRSIADKHGITDTAIHKHAKKHGWRRDLSKRVKSAAKSKLARAPVCTNGLDSGSQTDEQIIESASDEITQVVVGHRKQIAQWKGIATKLAVTLSEIDVDESSHNEFARSLNSGVDALGKCIKLERQAYSMDDADAEDAPPERSLTDDELEARIAELSAKLGG